MKSLISVSVTTDASGDFTDDTAAVSGRVVQVRYVPDGSSPLATGADLTIVGAKTGVSVLAMTNIGTSAFTKAPRQATHDVAGVASLYAAAGEPVESDIWVVGEAMTLTIAQGGNVTSGTFYIVIEQD